MIKRILLLGSGALKIGQAGEFDYSGSQAVKAFKEEGYEVVLINPNIATYQTSYNLADRVYFLPITEYFVEKVIEKENIDAIALSFGGQTALNCALLLDKRGVFKKYKVKVLGTSVDAIRISEDRKLFSQHLKKIHVPTPRSTAVSTVESAKEAARNIGFPVMIRAAYALGGQKSGVAYTMEECMQIVKEAFSFAPQVLIEQYLHHFKEIEYEIVRDKEDNCIAVCNMENMDPLGIHTGDSIVVAPSQTLTNKEYHFLRAEAIRIVRSLEIVGECNVQFALNPKPKANVTDQSNGDVQPIDHYVIELNPRLSRSSALASKATGYPLAYIAAKLILGKTLLDIENKVTKVTKAFFEPALDYIVIKLPRWDLEKFKGVQNELGSSMKSVGEVMAIGRKFEEALQKAVRMLDLGREGITTYRAPATKEELLNHLTKPTTRRLFALTEAFKQGMSVEKIYSLTGIDPWFLHRVKNVFDTENRLVKDKKSISQKQTLRSLKELGFSDRRIADIVGKKEKEVRMLRKKLGIKPAIFQIDTLAGEVPAQTNYLYTTYNGDHYDVEPLGKVGVMVLGSGPYRIGASVEFDWTCVNTAIALKDYKRKSIIINCNPETVSTDYDMSDRLYFEQLNFETVADIYEFESPEGVIVSVGGQSPHNIVNSLHEGGIKILGTQPESIDRVEDRNKFSDLCDLLHLQQPSWVKVTSIEKAVSFANTVSYPVLVRPSYVLSGAAMSVCNNADELKEYIDRATLIGRDSPVTVSKFVEDAKEIEFDAIAQDGEIIIHALSEHVENAGVHSGDATILFPPQRVYLLTEQKIVDAATKLARALKITGPFNIQFLGVNNDIFIIEMNARASRTFPFISRASSRNFARMIVDAIYGKGVKRELIYPEHVLVKTPQFSFSRIKGADPVLHVEMSSTGEAACFGDDVYEAFYKAILSVGERAPKKGVFVSLSGLENKMLFFTSVWRLKQMGLPVYATRSTHQFLKENGISTAKINKIHDKVGTNILTLLDKKKVDLVINITDVNLKKEVDDHTIMRRSTIDHNIHLITNINKARFFIRTIFSKKLEDLEVKAWDEYVNEKKKTSKYVNGNVASL